MPSKKTREAVPIAVPGVGVLRAGVLHVEKGCQKVVVRTPGTVGKEVGHHRQYVDILIRRTEQSRDGSIGVKEIILPPSTKERRIVLDVAHYRLVVLETIDFPDNGKYAKGERTPPEPRKPAAKPKKAAVVVAKKK